jgi:Predicted membrane protein
MYTLPLQQKQHEHRIRNINKVHDESLKFGDRASDGVASYVGSWRFVLSMTAMLAIWIIWNSISFLPHFDSAPFILLNLCLSFISGYTGPFVMMSQNRSAAKDRLMAEHDYEINTKGEEETRQLIAHLCEQDKQFMESYDKLLQQISILIELAKNKQ